MMRPPRHPALWFSALLGWFGLLWFLSSRQALPQPPLEIPQFDKLEHFTYFLIGGTLLTGGNFLRNPARPSWKIILLATILGIAAVGFIDEWHQCYTPGRSGGDPWDWLADFTGGTAGAFFIRAFHRRLT